MPRNPNKRQCDKIKANGERCERYAMQGKKKCYQHGRGAGPKKGSTNAKKPGSLYSKFYTEEEQAFIPEILAEINTVESEIVAASILLARLQKLLTDHWQGDTSAGRYEDKQTFQEATTEQISGTDNDRTVRKKHARDQVTQRTPDLWNLALQTLERLRRLKETRQTLKIEKLDNLIAQYEKTLIEPEEPGEDES